MTGILAALQAIGKAFSALFGFLDRKQLLDAGEARAVAKQKDETLETLNELNRHRTQSELDELWARNKAKHDAQRFVRGV